MIEEFKPPPWASEDTDDEDRGIARGNAQDTRTPPLDEKCREGGSGLKSYLQGSEIFSAGEHPP